MRDAHLFVEDLDVLRALAARWPHRQVAKLWPVHRDSLRRLTADREGGPLAARSDDGLRLTITDAGRRLVEVLA